MKSQPSVGMKLGEWLCVIIEIATFVVWTRVALLVVQPTPEPADRITHGRAAYRSSRRPP